MTMIAHYRLDGNAEDSIGNYDGNANNSLSFVDGKIGSALSCNGSSTTGFISQSEVSQYLNGKPEASIALWCKKNSIQYGFIQLSGYTSTNGNLYPYQQDNQVYLDIFRTNRLGPIYLDSSTLEWHHIVITQKAGQWRLYQNGVLQYETGANDEVRADYLQFEIGRNSNSRYADGLFDDVRIYDHSLSLREIRDLSQAKAAHFKFDQFSEPTENLLTVPLDPTSWVHYDNPDFGFVSDEYFTYNGKLGIGPNVPAYRRTVSGTDYRATRFDVPWTAHNDADLNKPLTTSIYVRCLNPSDNTRFNLNFQGTDSDGNRIDTSTQIPVGSDWVRIDNTRILADNGFVGLITRMKHYFRGDSVDRTWEVMMPQVEQKSGPTPFVEDSRQGFITDASNQGNNTEIALATSPRWVENTPIGSGAYEFNKVDTVITLPNAEPSIVGDMTISFWLNIRSDNVRTTLIDKAYGGEFTINLETNGPRLRLYRGDAGGNNHNYVSVTTGSIGMNKWVHATITVNGHTATWYLDGEFESSSTSSLFVGSKSNNNVRIGKGYTSGYVDGFLSDLRFYAEGFTPEEIKEIYQQRASLDDHGNLHTPQINNILNYDEAIGTSNLVLNANGELGDNTNFENFQYLGDGVFSRTSGSSTILHNDFIPIKGNGIDRFERYVLQGEVRGQDAQSRYYFMIACYNKFKQRINNEHMNFYSGTDTTLSQPLNSGDTWAYFNDVSGWRDSGTGSYINGMSFAYWLDSFDPIFVPLKYSNTHVRYLEVDTINNRVRLQNTWSGDSLPAGTLAINSRSGGTYSYIAASNDWTILGEWDYKESGPTSTTPSTGSMRFATEFVRVGWLMNRNSTGGTPTTQIKNVKFHAVSKDQNPTWISNGAGNEFKMQDFSEIGVANGLVAWYPLKSDVNDYAGGFDGVNNGATPLNGGYEFDRTTWIGAPHITSTDLLVESGNTFTVCGWFYHYGRTDTGIDSIVGASGGFGNSATFAIGVNHDNTIVVVLRGTQNYPIHNIVNNDWYYFYFTWDGSIAKFGISGQEPVSLNIGSIDDQGVGFGIGNHTDGTASGGTNGNPWFGLLKDIRYYDQVIPDEEILINHKYSLNNNNTKMSLTSDTVYINGEFSEV